MTIHIVYRSIRHPLGILEDTPVQVDKLIILCGFVVMDEDQSYQIPIILRRLFQVTAGAVINVPVGKISFQLYGERVDFYFPLATTILVPSPPVSIVLMIFVVSTVIFRIEVFKRDERP